MGFCLDLFKIRESSTLGQNYTTWLRTEFHKRRSFPVLFAYLVGIPWGSTSDFFEPATYERMIRENEDKLGFILTVSSVITTTLPVEKWNDPSWLTDEKIKRMADILFEFRYVGPAYLTPRVERVEKRLIEEIGYTEAESRISWTLRLPDAQRTALWSAPFEMPPGAQIQRFETGLIPEEEKEPAHEPELEPGLKVEPEIEPEKIEVALDVGKEVVIREKEEVVPEVSPETETEEFVAEAIAPGVQSLKEYLSTTEGKVVAGLGVFFLLRSLR